MSAPACACSHTYSCKQTTTPALRFLTCTACVCSHCLLPLLLLLLQLDSKLESAGLALWADIEVLPGSVPPDCADFIQQALTKDPRMRPSAQQLLQHPWLARCQAGEPWRDPLELEAARR
jgi:serine/threonine protein kinase